MLESIIVAYDYYFVHFSCDGASASSLKGGEITWLSRYASKRSHHHSTGNMVTYDDGEDSETTIQNKQFKFGINKDKFRGSKKGKNKKKHTKFDDCGNPMITTPSKVLSKAQHFMKTAMAEINSKIGDSFVGVGSEGDPFILSECPDVTNNDKVLSVSSDEEDSGDSGRYVTKPITLDSFSCSEETKQPSDDLTSNCKPTRTPSISLIGDQTVNVETFKESDANITDNKDVNENFNSNSSSKKKQKKKKKKKNRKQKKNFELTAPNPLIPRVSRPPEVVADPVLCKYWAQRYRLFSRFDEGILLDKGQYYAL